MSAEKKVVGQRWWSFDGCSFSRHDTEAEAKRAAEAALETDADDAREGTWSADVEDICWGPIAQAVVETRRLSRAEADAEGIGLAEEVDDLVEYALVDAGGAA